jgi:hypothetical protein
MFQAALLGNMDKGQEALDKGQEPLAATMKQKAYEKYLIILDLGV